jgi:hypothetical protein
MSIPKKWRTNVKYIFLAAAFTLATIASANADTTCAVNSPDGELNVRELTQNGPGKVIGVVKNGYNVTMRDFYFLRGQSWARVLDGKTKTRVVGWMFKDHLNCNIQTTTVQSVKRGTAVELKKSGAWTTFSDNTKKGTKVVGMYTFNNKSAFYVKYFSDADRLYVQLFKEGWQFPDDGVDVPLSIKFDTGPAYPATARARMDSGKDGVLIAVVEAAIDDPDLAGRFMADLMKADKMTVTFEQGDEKPWVADMQGTRETGTAFMKAVEALCPNCGKATQPYDATKPTQPYKPTAKKNERAI